MLGIMGSSGENNLSAMFHSGSKSAAVCCHGQFLHF